MARDQTAARVDQSGIVTRDNAGQSLKFAQVRLDQIDAFLERRLQRRSGRVDDNLGADFLARRAQRSEKILRHARRQAAAGDNECRPRLSLTPAVQAFLPFLLAERSARQDEAILLLGGVLEYREVLPGLLRRRDRKALDALSIHQAAKQLPGRAPGRIDGRDFAAEPLDDASDVDPASARVMARRARSAAW